MNLQNVISLPARAAVRTVLAMALGTVGCGGPVTFTEVRPLVKTSCALSSSCHAAAAMASGNLSLADADAYCALVGTAQGATFRSAAKAQFPRRVVPGDKSTSYLYKKLTLTTAESGVSSALGTVMPLNQPLDPDSISLFARWIDGGAQNDTGLAAPAGCN